MNPVRIGMDAPHRGMQRDERPVLQIGPSGFKPRPRYDVERNMVSGWTLNSVLTSSILVYVTSYGVW
jgi:hypothetical protein